MELGMTMPEEDPLQSAENLQSRTIEQVQSHLEQYYCAAFESEGIPLQMDFVLVCQQQELRVERVCIRTEREIPYRQQREIRERLNRELLVREIEFSTESEGT